MPLGSVLLPIEANAWFAVAGDVHSKGEYRFGFDPYSLNIFSQELIGHGAISVVLHSGSAYAKDMTQIPPSLAGHIRVADSLGRIEDRALRLLRPIASDLGFPADELKVINDPIIGPQRLSLDLPPDYRPVWSDLLRVLHGTYQFLLGMRERTQVDIPLTSYEAALCRLRDRLGGSESSTTLSFLIALARSYQTETAPALIPITSLAASDWAEVFARFVEDEEYRQYATIRHQLGIPERARESLERQGILLTRLLRNKFVRSIMQIAANKVAVSIGLSDIPLPEFGQPRYLPPIVSLTPALTDARIRWMASHSEGSRAIGMVYEGFEWLNPCVKSDERIVLTSVLPAVTFAFTLDSANFNLILNSYPATVDPQTPGWQQRTERFFADNLTPGTDCPVHYSTTSIKNVTITWDDAIKFKITTCCKSAAINAFAKMCSLSNPDTN